MFKPLVPPPPPSGDPRSTFAPASPPPPPPPEIEQGSVGRRQPVRTGRLGAMLDGLLHLRLHRRRAQADAAAPGAGTAPAVPPAGIFTPAADLPRAQQPMATDDGARSDVQTTRAAGRSTALAVARPTPRPPAHAGALPAGGRFFPGGYPALRQRREAMAQELQHIVSHPGFAIDKEPEKGGPALRHPQARVAGFGVPPSVMQIGDRFVKVDALLNGGKKPHFSAHQALLENHRQVMLGLLGHAPPAALLLQPAGAVAGRAAPLALSISQAVPGQEINLGDPGAMTEELRRPGWPATLALAYLLDMGDILKTHPPLLHNVIRSPDGKLSIIDGHDAGPNAVGLSMLPERSIQRLFGVPREQLAQALALAEQDCAELMQAQAATLDFRNPEPKRRAAAAVPHAQSFAAYVQGCRQRLATLAD